MLKAVNNCAWRYDFVTSLSCSSLVIGSPNGHGIASFIIFSSRSPLGVTGSEDIQLSPQTISEPQSS